MIRTKFYLQISYGCGSVLLRRHCATLCISGVMDYVMFGHNGSYGSRWRLHSATVINDMAMQSDINECLFIYFD